MRRTVEWTHPQGRHVVLASQTNSLGFVAFPTSRLDRLVPKRMPHGRQICVRPGHAKMSIMSPTGRTVEAVLKAVDKLYGDDEDENMDYHRWVSARAFIDQSGLSKAMHINALTYGEFDLHLFARSLKYTHAVLREDQDKGHIGNSVSLLASNGQFVDIGSGYGRICMAAAGILQGWKAIGIEIVKGLTEAADELRTEAEVLGSCCPWAQNVNFINSDYTEAGGAAEVAISTATIVFCFATTWPSGGTPYLGELSGVLGRLLRNGSFVITVDKQLVTDEDVGAHGARFHHLHNLTGSNRSTGESTAHIYRLMRNTD
jgi:Histone methylation protein DOT1